MEGKERKGLHQKQKMLYLVKIFMEETDDEHGLTMPEIIDKLANYDVNADRKTLYLDFEELRDFGIDIISEKSGRNCYYHIGCRDFELPELKLLVDSVQAAKFITEKKSNELIKKIEKLGSRYDAQKLNRQVIIAGRIKAINESIYYNVDKIHDAINADCQIRFKYFRWNLKKEPELRKDGDYYKVSPFTLLWDDEYYYLVAYDDEEKIIKHFRVDKMLDISKTDEKKAGKEIFKNFDAAKYSRSIFSMNSGEETTVILEAENDMVGIIIDRFGKNIMIIPKGKNHFTTNINVMVSDPFLGWIMSFGGKIKIKGPKNVVKTMKEEIKALSKVYSVK